MTQRRAMLLALAGLLALPAPALAQGKPAKPGKPAVPATVAEPAPPTGWDDRRTGGDDSPWTWDRVRRNRDRDEGIIRDWLRNADRDGLPPGLAKRESLPPGLAKQLRERGKLPPGLDKKLQPLPADLLRRLSPLPPDSRRGWFGNVVVEFGVKSGIAERILQIL